MNIFLYAVGEYANVKWNSDSDAFLSLKNNLLNSCKSALEPSNDCLLLSVDPETVDFLSNYANDNEKVSSFNSRKIEAFVKKLTDGQPFWLINGDSVRDSVRMSAFDALSARNARDSAGVRDAFEALINSYAEVESHYLIYAFGFDGLRVYVGETDKDKRVCRFCGNTGKGHFKDAAHAIPEALGNKILFCNEECDGCNHSLNKIEDNLTALMDVRRAVFRIKRKGTSDVPEVCGQNFVIRDDGSGNPLIYVMEESLPADWKNIPGFTTRLNLKYVTTNENIYKALVKIAIDLMPTQYLAEFKETIDWLTSDGRFIPDSLPDCHSAVLPKGIFYEQPQLLLYIRHDDDYKGPYCFALLRIYDICYRFVIPFARKDKGNFRKDESLSGFWNKLQTNPPLVWNAQNTSEWWHSAPWVDLDVLQVSHAFNPLPSADSIFDKCREKPEPPSVSFPAFDEGNIKFRFKKLEFKDLSKGISVSQEERADTSNDIAGPIFSFDNSSQSIGVDFNFTARAADKSRQYFSVKIQAEVFSSDYGRQVVYDEDSCAVNFAFIHTVWDAVIKDASRQIKNKSQYSQFKTINFEKHFSSAQVRMMRESTYRFVYDDKVIQMKYKCLHEDMPQSKRDKLIHVFKK